MLAARARLADGGKRAGVCQMHHKKRSIAGNLRQANRARSGFGLELGRARQRVIDRVQVFVCNGLLDEHVDGVAVFSVHHRQHAALFGHAAGS